MFPRKGTIHPYTESSDKSLQAHYLLYNEFAIEKLLFFLFFCRKLNSVLNIRHIIQNESLFTDYLHTMIMC